MGRQALAEIMADFLEAENERIVLGRLETLIAAGLYRASDGLFGRAG